MIKLWDATLPILFNLFADILAKTAHCEIPVKSF